MFFVLYKTLWVKYINFSDSLSVFIFYMETSKSGTLFYKMSFTGTKNEYLTLKLTKKNM